MKIAPIGCAALPLFVLITGMTFGADSDIAALSKQKNAVVVVAFGDSITLASRQNKDEKWTSILESRLNSKVAKGNITIINSGVGGNTSREGLARIEKDVLIHRPDLVLVEFGGNDATQTMSRHVTLKEFRSNLEKIRTLIEDNSKAQVVMLTFPPVIDEWHVWGKDPFFMGNGGGDKYVENYREITRQFAAEHELLLVDIDKALRAEIDRSSRDNIILRDGVHLTTAGNQVLANTIAEKLVAPESK